MVVVKSVMKTVVFGIEQYYSLLARGMKHEMTIEYLECRADLNVEVDFGVNDAIGTILTKWDHILLG